MENRNGLIAATMATQADGYAEREAALLLLKESERQLKADNASCDRNDHPDTAPPAANPSFTSAYPSCVNGKAELSV